MNGVILSEKEYLETDFGPNTYGLFGYPAGHSFSPELQQALFAENGVKASFYVFEVPSEDLTRAVGAARVKLRGFNCTLPHKQAVMALLDGLTDEARMIGAVNAVAVRDGKLFGHNTDLYGFAGALARDGCALDGRRVLLLGYGGAARMMACHALKSGAELTVAGRDPKKAEKMAEEVRAACGHRHRIAVESLADARGSYDVVLNATPLGMWPKSDGCPIELSRLDGVSYVFDAVYNPQETRLVKAARALGIPAQSGLSMLALQAAGAQSFWTGCSFSDAALGRLCGRAVYMLARRRLRDAHGRTNIILTGFMGSGKTTVGKLLAERMGMAFFDLDTQIESEAGMTVSELFERYGEAHFRALEAERCRALRGVENTVVATGGGAPIPEQNACALREAGVVVFLNPPVEFILENIRLDRSRPLLESEDREERARSMYGDRLPAYRQSADIELTLCGTAEDRVRAIAERI